MSTETSRRHAVIDYAFVVASSLAGINAAGASSLAFL